MAYRRSASRRTGSRRVSSQRGRYSRSPVRTRRASGGRRTSAGGTRTVRLVIEQAAPTVAPVQAPSGQLMVPDNSSPKRAKF